jgi:hypothetical protein
MLGGLLGSRLNMKVAAAMALIGMMALGTEADADSITSVANAQRLCMVLDGMGDLSEKCKVTGWGSSVEISLDTSSREARKICDGIVATMRKTGTKFDPGWKLKIFSPFSGTRTIAVCDLR